MSLHNDYFHWLFGENILRHDHPTYLINLEHGLAVRFNYSESYFATFEHFVENIADVQFLSGHRPGEEELEALLTDAWNFLAHFEQEEENRFNAIDDD